MGDDFSPPAMDRQYECAYAIFEYHIDGMTAVMSGTEVWGAIWALEAALVSEHDWNEEICQQAAADALDDCVALS